MYTREEFEQLRLESAAEMAKKTDLRQQAIDVLVEADKHYWFHQTNWMGEPILNTAQDMFALQEIIFRTRPEHIIEVGVAWAGSLLFYSTLMEVLGGKSIVGIDIYIPDDLKERIKSHERLASRIELLNASSVEEDTLAHVRRLVEGSERVMVVLDSNHTHDHVLEELRLYAPFVKPGQYLVVSDTIIEEMPRQEHRPRPWGPGNNPMTAVRQFLSETDRFEVDTALENKLLFSCNPNGYLRCVR